MTYSRSFAFGGPKRVRFRRHLVDGCADSDLNLSYRLQQMTALKVSPDGLFLRLTEKSLADYPFIYMVEPGSLFLSDTEAKALRDYLLNGGFLCWMIFGVKTNGKTWPAS